MTCASYRVGKDSCNVSMLPVSPSPYSNHISTDCLFVSVVCQTSRFVSVVVLVWLCWNCVLLSFLFFSPAFVFLFFSFFFFFLLLFLLPSVLPSVLQIMCLLIVLQLALLYFICNPHFFKLQSCQDLFLILHFCTRYKLCNPLQP